MRALTSLLASSAVLASLVAGAGATGAAGGSKTVTVTITNLTANQVFSPPLVATHQPDADVFEPGTPASAELAELAENGDNGPLLAALGADADVVDVMAASAPLAPGESMTFTLAVQSRATRVSALGMLVSSNDAFFGLDSVAAPFNKNRPLSEFVPAYDAGSEANSEDCAFVPGPPCGAGAVHDPQPAEGFVHVSNGIRGIGGIPAETYDWSNPVARIVIARR